jgi:acetyl esterase/lipase
MQKFVLSAACLLLASAASAADPAETLKLWPGTPPGDENVKLEPEQDITKPEDKLIAGRRIIKLANVATPTLAVFPAPSDKATGASVIVCPGGGHRILAWDLEGTEVAEWLNSLGVTAFVLKYRVPARTTERRWTAAVQDAQRAMSLVRSRAGEWGLDQNRIGILGFSAGGETAGLTAIFGAERQYAALDDVDKVPSRPDFALLIYPGGLADRETKQLQEYVKVTSETPPMFFVHAFDDGVPVESSVLTFLKLKQAGVPSELHVYDRGGHGYGLRPTDAPVTSWPERAEGWMRASGWLTK